MHAALGVMAGFILSLASAAVIGVAHFREQSRRLQVILLGQLDSLQEHCLASERSLKTGNRELVLRLRLSKYGEISSLSEAMTKVGHLDEKIITRLIQLSLKVRNNDIEIEHALERIATGEPTVDLDGIARRLGRAAKHAADLATKIREIELPLCWPLKIGPRPLRYLQKVIAVSSNIWSLKAPPTSVASNLDRDHQRR